MRKLTGWLLAGILVSALSVSEAAPADTTSDALPLTAPLMIELPAAEAPTVAEEPLEASENIEILPSSCLPSSNEAESVSTVPVPDRGALPESVFTAPAPSAKPATSVAPKVKIAVANKTANGKKTVAAKKGQPQRAAKQMLATNTSKIATNHKSPAPPAGVGKQVQVKAYAYCINGRTASGTRTALGTVAVDPRLIPLGSKVYIPGYGWGTALDTGGHMRGKVIDIWYPSYGQCMQWGARQVTITVLPR